MYCILCWKWKAEWLYEYRMIVSVTVVHPGMAGKWCQHHERGLYHLLLAWEKVKIQNLKLDFYWMCMTFAPSLSWKIKSNPCRSGTVCIECVHLWWRDVRIFVEKRRYLKGQSFRVILKGGRGDVGSRYSGCSLLTPQDLLFTLVTPFYAPVAPLDAWHRPSAMVSASCCVQSMKAVSGARETWWAGEGEAGTPHFLSY